MDANDPYGWQNSLQAYAAQQAPAQQVTQAPQAAPTPTPVVPVHPVQVPTNQYPVTQADWLNYGFGPQGRPSWMGHPQWREGGQQGQSQVPVATPGGGGTGAPLQGGQQFQPFDANRQSRWRDAARQWHSSNWQAQTPSTAVTPPDGTVHAL